MLISLNSIHACSHSHSVRFTVKNAEWFPELWDEIFHAASIHDFFFFFSGCISLLSHLWHSAHQSCAGMTDVWGTHGGSRSSEGQAEQHEQGDELVACLDVRHAERAVVTAEAHLGRLEDISQLQEIQWDHGGGHNGQLGSTEGKAKHAGQNRPTWVTGKIM